MLLKEIKERFPEKDLSSLMRNRNIDEVDNSAIFLEDLLEAFSIEECAEILFEFETDYGTRIDILEEIGDKLTDSFNSYIEEYERITRDTEDFSHALMFLRSGIMSCMIGYLELAKQELTEISINCNEEVSELVENTLKIANIFIEANESMTPSTTLQAFNALKLVDHGKDIQQTIINNHFSI